MATVRGAWYGDEFGDAIAQGIVDGLNNGALIVFNETQRQLGRFGTGAVNVTPSPPGQPPGNRSNRLRGSISIVNATRQLPRALVGTNVKYARIHELGGTIRPTRARYLGIPVGVHGRRMARDSGGGWRQALQDPMLYTIRSKAGKLVTIHPDHGVVIAWRNEVTLPRRPFLGPSFVRSKKSINDAINKAIQRRMSQVSDQETEE